MANYRWTAQPCTYGRHTPRRGDVEFAGLVRAASPGPGSLPGCGPVCRNVLVAVWEGYGQRVSRALAALALLVG
jgi:hypothetical protein